MARAETQFKRAMRATKRKEKEHEKDKGARAVGGARCGAKKRDGGKCMLAAGQGTTHPGLGKCKFHGGSAPNSVKKAAREAAVLLGAPKEINPLDAIIWCIKMTAGEIEFYTDQMAELEKTQWVEDTVMGQQMHVFARMRAEAQERLVKFSKDAIQLGLTERAVKLAEQYGNTISVLVRGILDDLMPYISYEGQQKIPKIVRHHLLLAERGSQDLHEFAHDRIRELEAAS
jgi:hypothetical protein